MHCRYPIWSISGVYRPSRGVPRSHQEHQEAVKCLFLAGRPTRSLFRPFAPTALAPSSVSLRPPGPSTEVCLDNVTAMSAFVDRDRRRPVSAYPFRCHLPTANPREGGHLVGWLCYLPIWMAMADWSAIRAPRPTVSGFDLVKHDIEPPATTIVPKCQSRKPGRCHSCSIRPSRYRHTDMLQSAGLRQGLRETSFFLEGDLVGSVSLSLARKALLVVASRGEATDEPPLAARYSCGGDQPVVDPLDRRLALGP
ncbi:hypothetical protein GGR56DRAFT_331914 [Xylariaceae sp. FL0804]|nr:hypothetical protein GGR56DRAFT_331914 [Xylariaceae sp. FL0804]